MASQRSSLSLNFEHTLKIQRIKTYHSILDLEISDDKSREFLLRNWVHHVVLMFSGAITGPVLVTTLLNKYKEKYLNNIRNQSVKGGSFDSHFSLGKVVKQTRNRKKMAIDFQLF